MKRFVTPFSLALNCVLLGAIIFVLRQPAERVTSEPVRELETVFVTQMVARVSQTNVASSATPFNWSQIESDDFLVYASNLRGIGCPEQTVRDILTEEIEQLFVQRRQDLFCPLQSQYWDLMAKNGDDLIDEKLHAKLNTLRAEKDALLKDVLKGGRDPENILPLSEHELILGDLLPEEKAQRLRVITQELAKLNDELAMSDPADLEAKKRNAEASEKLIAQRDQILSPDELNEFNLRKSRFAQKIQGMGGFEASEDELRELARLESVETAANRQNVDEQIKTLLGEKRFEDFTRSTNSSYNDLNRVGRRYGLPRETIAQAYDLVRAAHEQVDALQSATQISGEQREAALESLREQTQAALISKLGNHVAEAYRRNSDDWDKVARP